MIVTQAARDGCASRKIFGNERTHHIALEALLMIDYIIRNADMLGHASSVIDIVQRATAPGHLLGHALMSRQPPLVPQLHSQPDNVVPLRVQHRRDGGRIHTARHGYRNGLGFHHGETSNWQLVVSSRPSAPNILSEDNG